MESCRGMRTEFTLIEFFFRHGFLILFVNFIPGTGSNLQSEDVSKV